MYYITESTSSGRRKQAKHEHHVEEAMITLNKQTQGWDHRDVYHADCGYHEPVGNTTSLLGFAWTIDSETCENVESCKPEHTWETPKEQSVLPLVTKTIVKVAAHLSRQKETLDPRWTTLRTLGRT